MSKPATHHPTEPPAGQPAAARAAALLILLFILLLAGGLRFYRLDGQSLWNDEGTSVALAGQDLAAITRAAAADIHPPLYYWLLAGWVRLAGTDEIAVRGLSALVGVLLVALTYSLGRLLTSRASGLAAAGLAAIHPFQVYYAQEARMYILLAFWAALAFYGALRWLAVNVPQRGTPAQGAWGWGLVYVLAATAGLYTHYAFALALLAINLVVLLGILRQVRARRGRARGDEWRCLVAWLGFQAGALLLFAPWLPVAYRQLVTWPRLGASTGLVVAAIQMARTFVTGPGALPWFEAGWLLLIFVLFYVLVRPRPLASPVAHITPLVWLLVPVVGMLGLGLYREAYQKFLIVASPAYCLMAGWMLAGPWRTRDKARHDLLPFISFGAAVLLVGASVVGLVVYFTDPAQARDDYRGMVTYIDAVARPGDAIVLNAEGQQEVFGYYYQGSLPVYPLPERRPLDPEATRARLESLARPGARVYAVLWGTDESDPERVVEGWLDTHAYKASDAWYGNVRLVVYAVPDETPAAPAHQLDVVLTDPATGDEITLLGYSLLNDRLVSGDIAQVTLFWQAQHVPARRYKVFLHVLDDGNQIVGQRDAEPGGGVRLTTGWAPGEVVRDNYGVPIHPASPPGRYRVEVGMYDAETGQRLLTPDGEGQVWLDPLTVDRPAAPAPVPALGMEEQAGVDWGALALLGYDLHELGMAHQPDAPLLPGDVLELSLYWRAEEPAGDQAVVGGDWQIVIELVDERGQPGAAVTSPPVSGYPTSLWLAGDVWRGHLTLPLPAHLSPGRYSLRLRPTTPAITDAFVTEPITIQAP